MTRKSYYEKLKDPRWQKKRLETLSHYEFSCQSCGDDKSSLHVHHKEYFKGHEPWEYHIEQLTVLCEECHELEHEKKDAFKFISSFLEEDGPRDRHAIALLIAGYIGFDYQFLLSNSDIEDCAWARAYYSKGISAEKIDLNFRNFIEQSEK